MDRKSGATSTCAALGVPLVQTLITRPAASLLRTEASGSVRTSACVLRLARAALWPSFSLRLSWSSADMDRMALLLARWISSSVGYEASTSSSRSWPPSSMVRAAFSFEDMARASMPRTARRTSSRSSGWSTTALMRMFRPPDWMIALRFASTKERWVMRRMQAVSSSASSRWSSATPRITCRPSCAMLTDSSSLAHMRVSVWSASVMYARTPTSAALGALSRIMAMSDSTALELAKASRADSCTARDERASWPAKSSSVFSMPCCSMAEMITGMPSRLTTAAAASGDSASVASRGMRCSSRSASQSNCRPRSMSVGTTASSATSSLDTSRSEQMLWRASKPALTTAELACMRWMALSTSLAPSSSYTTRWTDIHSACSSSGASSGGPSSSREAKLARTSQAIWSSSASPLKWRMLETMAAVAWFSTAT
mmetsp:Transcript_10418/g.40525  ORF Transcript_10418/g.40525 Transcript_10418/m.40525 type:complete len:429 (+) Transcript_10418:436-1722(+)